MIIDAIVGMFLGIADGLIGLLPAADLGPAVPLATDGFSQVLGTMMILDEGLPVHELIAAVSAYIAAALLIDAFILLRAFARWLPSWVTGGG